MSIALGEGIIPGDPLKYIKEYCGGGGCWAGPNGPPISLEDFIIETSLFNVNQRPDDGQKTLGPWQTMSEVMNTDDVNVRVAEAIGYVQSCCMDGSITVNVNSDSKKHWCVGRQPANCANAVDGRCENPNRPGDPSYPVTTIQKSHLSPALTFCGCRMDGGPTTGYSGRCARQMKDFYTRYEALAKAVCDAA